MQLLKIIHEYNYSECLDKHLSTLCVYAHTCECMHAYVTIEGEGRIPIWGVPNANRRMISQHGRDRVWWWAIVITLIFMAQRS